MSPRFPRWFLNLWPPYLGAGVRVRLLADDYREALVEIRLGWTNRNSDLVDEAGKIVARVTHTLYVRKNPPQ